MGILMDSLKNDPDFLKFSQQKSLKELSSVDPKSFNDMMGNLSKASTIGAMAIEADPSLIRNFDDEGSFNPGQGSFNMPINISKNASAIGQAAPEPAKKLEQAVPKAEKKEGKTKLGTFLTSVGHSMLGMPIEAQTGDNPSWINYLGANIGNEIKDMRVTENGVPVKTTSPTFYNTAEDKFKKQQEVMPSETTKRQAALLGINPSEYKEGDKLYAAISEKAMEGTARENRIAQAQDFRNTTALRQEFNNSPIKKDFDILNRAFKNVSKAFLMSTNADNKSRIASDQALGVMIQKMLDPQSVVRESEYARTPEGAALMNRLQGILPQLAKGGMVMSDVDRKAIVDMAEQLYNAGGETYNAHYDRYNALALEYGLDPDKSLGAKRWEPTTIDTPNVPVQAGQTIDYQGKQITVKKVGYDKDGRKYYEY